MHEAHQRELEEDTYAPSGPARFVPLLCVATLAGLICFWQLGTRALWQDEAACAVMAERMLETGKPMAYDGRNLLTMDEFHREEGQGLAARTGKPQTAIDYYVAKGDFKGDTTWIGQPWGQFVWTALSFRILGTGTLQARLPFALAGVLTALVLFAFARHRLRDPWVAGAAVVLLLGSAYWVLHVRQCRYYATSSLFLLLSVATYFRWQDRPKSLARMAVFVLTACVYFHNDFGSFWPVMGVLTLDALVAALREDRSRALSVLATFAVIGLLVAPFVFYYELATWDEHGLGSGRLKKATTPPDSRFGILLVYLNQFQLPLVLLPLLAVFAFVRRRVPGETRVVLVCLAIVLAQLAWMTAVSPFPFYRYLVDLTPVSSLLVAYVLIGAARAWLPRAVALPAGAALVSFVLVTPFPALATRGLIPVPELIRQVEPPSGTFIRHELGVLAKDLGQRFPDPNGELVRWLEERLRPGDEVVINYEDAPLMFYLDNPIRGGIACFRAEDDPPPRFLVLRHSVPFTHQDVYNRLLRGGRWKQPVQTAAPDVTWGNNPDPWCHFSRQMNELRNWGGITVFERAPDG